MPVLIHYWKNKLKLKDTIGKSDHDMCEKIFDTIMIHVI